MNGPRCAGVMLFCGGFLWAGCTTTDGLQRANRDHYGNGDPVYGSRLELPRHMFTGSAGGAENGPAARGESTIDITDPRLLAPAVPGTYAGRAANAGVVPQAPPSPPKVEDNPAPSASRIVVYTAAFRIVASEVDPALQQAKSVADSAGGYVQEIVGDTITIRVPAARFDEAVKKIEALGNIVSREVKSLDVTEDYVDLEARLKSAERTRDRLLALLEKAGDVKAMLEVEREIGRVNEEIEKITGKLNVLKSRVAFSAITICFERVAPRVAAAAGAHELPFHWLRELRPGRLWE